MTTCLLGGGTQVTAATPDDIMIACDDRYCDPFDSTARDRVQALLIAGLGASLPGRFGPSQTPSLARPGRATQVSQPAMELVRKSTTVAATSANRGCTQARPEGPGASSVTETLYRPGTR